MIEDVVVPQEGANDPGALVVRCMVSDGDLVQAGQPLVEVETAKVTIEIPSLRDGYALIPVVPGQTVPVGGVVAHVCTMLREVDELRSQRQGIAGAAEAASADGTRFSRLARDYIDRNNLPLSLFEGRGLVTLKDVKHLTAATTAPGNSAGTVEPLGRSKILEIERLSSSNVLNACLSITLSGEGVRKRAAAASMPSIWLLAEILHAVAQTVRKFPNLNAYYDDRSIRRYPSIDLGVALDLDRGLKVGVVNSADQLLPEDIEDRLTELVTRYARGSLTLEDVSGPTITVSDLSTDDIAVFQPLLNARQALAIGVGGDQAAAGSPISLTATFDHRVTSGREVAQFLNGCRRLLSSPDTT